MLHSNNMSDEAYVIILFIITAANMIVFLLNTDRTTDALSALALSVAVLASLFSVKTARETREQTNESLKLTETTLIKTEKEQQIRDIEKSFDFFYYPLRDYIEYPLKTLLDDSLEKSLRYPKDIENIAHYRYLATDETREQFEIYQNMGFPLNKEHIEDIQKLLYRVIDDINVKQTDLGKGMNNF